MAKSDKVSFQLKQGFDAIREALPGGRELAVDAGDAFETDDPALIRRADAHHALKRATKEESAP